MGCKVASLLKRWITQIGLGQGHIHHHMKRLNHCLWLSCMLYGPNNRNFPGLDRIFPEGKIQRIQGKNQVSSLPKLDSMQWLYWDTRLHHPIPPGPGNVRIKPGHCLIHRQQKILLLDSQLTWWMIYEDKLHTIQHQKAVWQIIRANTSLCLLIFLILRSWRNPPLPCIVMTWEVYNDLGLPSWQQ